MILNKRLDKRIYENKISGKKYEEEIDQYSDYEVDQLTRIPHSNLKENDSMSNGTKTSSLVTHTLQGGWDDTRIVFTIIPAYGGVMIRHHNDRNNPEKYVHSFHIDIDGRDTVINADTQYNAEFARKVWNLFVNLKPMGSHSPWTRVD